MAQSSAPLIAHWPSSDTHGEHEYIQLSLPERATLARLFMLEHSGVPFERLEHEQVLFQQLLRLTPEQCPRGRRDSQFRRYMWLRDTARAAAAAAAVVVPVAAAAAVVVPVAAAAAVGGAGHEDDDVLDMLYACYG